MTINFDFDYNEIENFKKFCQTHKIEIVKFIETGPAGGNPNVTIRIYNSSQLNKLNKFYFG